MNCSGATAARRPSNTSSSSPLTTVAADTFTGFGFLPVGAPGRSSRRLLALGTVAPLFGIIAGDGAGTICKAAIGAGVPGIICKARPGAGMEGNMVGAGGGVGATAAAATLGATGGPLNGHAAAAAGPLNAGDAPAAGGGGAEKKPREKGGGGPPAIAPGGQERSSQT